MPSGNDIVTQAQRVSEKGGAEEKTDRSVNGGVSEIGLINRGAGTY